MKYFHFTVILLIFVLIISSCSMPAQPTQDVNAISTFAAQTVSAMIPAATQPLATQPLSTQIPVECKDEAGITGWQRNNVIFDAKESSKPLAPNTPFTIAWTFKNIGACIWDSGYLMYYESGTSMTQSASYPLMPAGQIVSSGQSVTVSISMTSPANAGDYEASWRLQNSSGVALMTLGLPIKVGRGSSQSPLSADNLRYTYDCTSGVVKITLMWIDIADNEEGYRVYRDGAPLLDLAAGTNTYTDIAPGIGSYSYVVAAFNAAGESPAKVSATTTNYQ